MALWKKSFAGSDQAQLVQVGDDLAVVQHADDDALELVPEFYPHDRHDRNAEADVVIVDHTLDESVLGHFALEAVHAFRAVLDDRSDRLGHGAFLHVPQSQRAVDPEPEFGPVSFLGDDMDVTGTGPDGLDEGALHQVDQGTLGDLGFEGVFVDDRIVFLVDAEVAVGVLELLQILVLRRHHLFHQVLQVPEAAVGDFVLLAAEAARDQRDSPVGRIGRNDDELVGLLSRRTSGEAVWSG